MLKSQILEMLNALPEEKGIQMKRNNTMWREKGETMKVLVSKGDYRALLSRLILLVLPASSPHLH